MHHEWQTTRNERAFLLRSGDRIPLRLGERLALETYTAFRNTEAFLVFIAFSALLRPDFDSDTIVSPLQFPESLRIDASSYQLLNRADQSITPRGLVVANMVYVASADIENGLAAGWLREPFRNKKILAWLYDRRHIPPDQKK